MTEARTITLFLDPFSRHYHRDALFEMERGALGGDDQMAPYIYLRNWFGQRGIRVHTADRLLSGESVNKTNVYISFGIQESYRTLAKRSDVVLSAFFAFEGPIVEPTLYLGLDKAQQYFRRILSFSDGESLRPFLRRPLTFQQFHIPQSFDAVHEEIWRREDRQFLVMINANKLPALYVSELYTERLRAVEYFGRTAEIDLYGVGWDGPSYQLGISRVPGSIRRLQRKLVHQWQRFRPDPLLEAARRVYQGIAVSKAETLGKYTFALCFENQVLNGWVTEKIFDCFFTGTIPVYWGAPDIETYVPKRCFIDMRDFEDYQELSLYLRSLEPRDIRAFKENARNYLQSPSYQPFTKAAFTELVARIVEEDTGVSLRREHAPRFAGTGACASL